MGKGDYSELLGRIDRRRDAVGGISETQACLRAGLARDCIRTIRRGHAPRAETLKALARALDCAPSYFLEVVGLSNGIDLTDHSGEPSEDEDAERSEEIFAPGYVSVRVLLDRPGMGSPSLAGPDNFGSPELMPERLIRTELRGEPDQFLLFEVEGSSMSPILESGDRVLIDVRKKIPAQPGIFVVREPLGYVAKWVQYLPNSEPPKLKITSENPRFDPYDILLEEVQILGRVVWYARKL